MNSDYKNLSIVLLSTFLAGLTLFLPVKVLGFNRLGWVIVINFTLMVIGLSSASFFGHSSFEQQVKKNKGTFVE